MVKRAFGTTCVLDDAGAGSYLAGIGQSSPRKVELVRRTTDPALAGKRTPAVWLDASRTDEENQIVAATVPEKRAILLWR